MRGCFASSTLGVGRCLFVLLATATAHACSAAHVDTAGGPPAGAGAGAVDIGTGADVPAPTNTGGPKTDGGDPKPPTDGAPGPCVGLCARQTVCPGGATTTISGTVHAPTPPRFGAADPLYNALVYVPNAPVAAFTPGVSCQRCERASGSPLVSALTGPDGTFRLTNVPTGSSVPLVIQIGRWRRQVVIPNVAACSNTALPDGLTRLPRNKSEGDIPAMAIATGQYDPFDCVLRKIGIDEAEFTLPTGNGRVNVWAYGGDTLEGAAPTPRGEDLMSSAATLNKYDILLLPCDDNGAKPADAVNNLVNFTNHGGRLFLSDFGFSWLRANPVFDARVTWRSNPVGEGRDFVAQVDTSFPKGMAFSSWLTVVGAAMPAGQLPIHDPYGGESLIDKVVPPTQRWLYTTRLASTIQHFTFNTPVAAADDQQCGRVVYSQFHVARMNGSGADEGTGVAPVARHFPSSCDDKPMTPQEKALEFMLFDLSSCVQSDQVPPVIIP